MNEVLIINFLVALIIAFPKLILEVMIATASIYIRLAQMVGNLLFPDKPKEEYEDYLSDDLK